MSLRELFETDDPDFLLYVQEVVDFVSETREQAAREING